LDRVASTAKGILRARRIGAAREAGRRRLEKVKTAGNRDLAGQHGSRFVSRETLVRLGFAFPIEIMRFSSALAGAGRLRVAALRCATYS
jgi:hypothetical protein